MNEDKAARYHRLRRRSAVLAAGWSVLLLAGLLLTGASHQLRDLASSAAAGLPPVLQIPGTAGLWAAMVGLLHEAGALPFACFAGFVLERRYGLSRQSAGEWLRDHLKALGIGLVFGVAALTVVYLVLALWPGVWWAVTWLAAVAVGVLLTWVAPVLLLPLFFKVTPLQNDILRRRLILLAERLGAPAIDVFEWRMSDRTSRANAMLTGLGRTRRILVSDTLVADYDADEVEVILAHELAHHVRRDVWRGLFLEAAVAAVGLWAASAVLGAAVEPLGLAGPADVAGAPVILLTLMAVSFATLPVANAVSRAHERRADRAALDATGNGRAFLSAMRRLAARNLAEESPSWLVRMWFYTHPPIEERLAFARDWQQQREGQ